jgi:plasmid stability protein
MRQIVIRNLDDTVLVGLKKIAWMDGETPEQTARRLLIEAVRTRTTQPQPFRASEPAA